ncbi:MAG: hypothetical protein ACR2QS_00320 [Woeseiaceae bacterium]
MNRDIAFGFGLVATALVTANLVTMHLIIKDDNIREFRTSEMLLAAGLPLCRSGDGSLRLRYRNATVLPANYIEEIQ